MRNIDSTSDSGGARKIRHRGILDSKIAHHQPIFEFFSSLLVSGMRRGLDVVGEAARVHVALAAQGAHGHQRIAGRGIGDGLLVPQGSRPEFSP
jgi:hypothetical protein